MPTDLLVIGSGSLARALCNSIAVLPLTVGHARAAVAVVARDAEKAQELAYIAGVRAHQAREANRSAPVVEFRSAKCDLTHVDALAEVIGRAEPRIVVQCASLHSPWHTAPGFAAQVAAAGFGITLPLQARLVIQTATAIERTGSSATLINACFPDAVNPLLARVGLSVLCGLGNVATLAAGLAAASDAPVRMLAHHAHLHAPRHPSDEARAWLGESEVPDVAARLARQRSADRRQLNQITGYTSARLLADLLADRDVTTNLPGPLGRPGGYPVVRLAGTALVLDLPPGLTESEAIAFNERAAARDGVVLDGDRVRFTRSVPGVGEGFSVWDTVAIADRLGTNDRMYLT